MNAPWISRARLYAASVCLLALAACGGGGGGSDEARVSGTVLFPGAALTKAPALQEVEGNDSFDGAQRLPRLEAGQGLFVQGRIGGTDEFDGFGLTASQSLSVEVELTTPQGPSGAALRVFDPVGLRFVPLRPGPEGTLAFTLCGPVQLVVESLGAPSEYVLSVNAWGPPQPGGAQAGTSEPPRPEAARASELAGEPASWSLPHARAYGLPALEFVPGDALVEVRDAALVASHLAQVGGAAQVQVERLQLARFPIPAGFDGVEASRYTAALAAWLDARPGVEMAELNFVRRACSTTPNDTYYSLQWHYPLIQLPAAWDISTGDSNVLVAVIDTGETQHPDLVARQVPGYDFISSAANAGDGNGIDPDPTDVGDGNGLTPSSFHGTHVAGTIGADTDNSSGVAGVTWAGEIMHLRVLGLQGGTDFDIIQAINYSAQLANASGQVPPKKANIINMSLGGPGSSQSFQNAITNARNAGVTIFGAAGNNNSPNAFYPASYNGVISVSAVDLNSAKAPYSNFNNAVDIAAPGGNTSVDLNGDGYSDGVLSTLADDTQNPLAYNYVFYQGTSMACPHAAGVASLMIAVNPTLTPAQIEQILTSTATDLGAAGKDPIFGHGLVNAYAAVANAQGGAGSGQAGLGLSTTALGFPANISTLDVTVTNIGDPTVKLLVNDPTVSTVSGGPWLGAVRIASSSATTDTARIRVSVDRTGLALGTYAGQVDVTSNGGNATISVALTVANASTNPDVDVFVLLVRYSDFQTVDQDQVNPTVELDYALRSGSGNDFLLVAGSDDDNDGFIGGDNDQYFGAWPSLGELQILSLSDGANKQNTDFPVEDFFNQPPGPQSAAQRRSFRLLATP